MGVLVLCVVEIISVQQTKNLVCVNDDNNYNLTRGNLRIWSSTQLPISSCVSSSGSQLRRKYAGLGFSSGGRNRQQLIEIAQCGDVINFAAAEEIQALW